MKDRRLISLKLQQLLPTVQNKPKKCVIFVLWRKFNPNWNEGKLCKRLLFLEELGKALIAPKIQRRTCPPQAAAAVALVESVKADEARPTENPEAKTGDGEKAQKI